MTAPETRFAVRLSCVARRLVATLALLLALPLAAQELPLARLANGETITAAQLQAYVARRLDLRGTVRNYWGALQALQEMALTRALVLAGHAQGVPQRSDAGDDRFDDIYAQTVYKRLMPACERPADEAAAHAWFKAHPQAFVLPPMARLARVILPLEQQVQKQPARQWLMTQAEAIAQGRSTLDAVAQEAEHLYRLDAQGDLGWVTLEGDSAVMRALAEAARGDLVGPLQEGQYVYLFQVVDKREAQPLSWEQVRNSAAQRAVSWCREHGREQVRDELFAQYGVRLDKEAVRALFDGDAAPQPPGTDGD